jgi:hypothetical protein
MSDIVSFCEVGYQSWLLYLAETAARLVFDIFVENELRSIQCVLLSCLVVIYLRHVYRYSPFRFAYSITSLLNYPFFCSGVDSADLKT